MKYLAQFNVGTGFNKDGEHIDPSHVIMAQAAFRGLLSREFGGFTETATMGGWVDGSGELVVEPGLQFVSMVESATIDTAKRKAEEVAAYMAGYLGQESVMLSITPAVVSFVEGNVEAIGGTP